MIQQHQILVGDCIDMMRTLPDKPAHHCGKTPFFDLRGYGVEGHIAPEKPCAPSSSPNGLQCSEKCFAHPATTARIGEHLADEHL